MKLEIYILVGVGLLDKVLVFAVMSVGLLFGEQKAQFIVGCLDLS